MIREAWSLMKTVVGSRPAWPHQTGVRQGPLQAPRPAPSWVTQATWAFVVLGLATRLVRYLVVYPLWHDEAFVAVNFLDRGFLDLLRPLDYQQVAPAAFLWIELLAVRLLGFAEWTTRLFPVVCGLASVLVFHRLAGRLLEGTAKLAAVAIFAVSFYPIRHAAEVKPYASDLLASLILLVLAAEWLAKPRQSRFFWLLSALAPILLAVSYPAVLVGSGIALALGIPAIKSDLPRVRMGFAVYCVVLAASFLAIYFAATYAQSEAVRVFYREGYWRDAFPPWHAPWLVPFWLIAVHAGTTLAYPVGGERGASAATLLACLWGALVLWRSGRRQTLALLLAPVAMGLVAASLGRYPYGGAPRLTQYLAPTFCLLAGLGSANFLERMSRQRLATRNLRIALVMLAVLGGFVIVGDIARPYRVIGDKRTRDFARWFWTDFAAGPELVCVKDDLGLVYQGRPNLWRSGMSAVYLCHRAMFARSAGRSKASSGESLLAGRPVRLVFFDAIPRDDPAIGSLMARLEQSYVIGRAHEFVIAPGKPGEPWLRDRYLVLPLEPLAGAQRDRGETLAQGAISTQQPTTRRLDEGPLATTSRGQHEPLVNAERK